MSERSLRPPSVAQRLLTSMVKGSMLFAHAAWLLAIGIGLIMDGGLGAVNAAVGGALVVAFFSVGQGVQLLSVEADPRAGMGISLLSFLGRAALLGGVLVLATRSGQVEQYFSPPAFLVGVFTVLSGWLAGMFIVHSRARIPIYDHDIDH